MDYRDVSVCTTHNHKALIGQKWIKVDQAKQKEYCTVMNGSSRSCRIDIELNKLQNVKLFEKEKVYDITLHEHSNFLTRRHIIHNSIEQDADLVLMLYKEDEVDNRNAVDIVIAKHRSGPVGSFRLLFYADICKFVSIDDTDTIDKY